MAGIAKKGIVTLNPRHQFMKYFESFLEERLNKNEGIILRIDVNKETLPAAEIHQLARQLDLIDVHHHMHGATLAPPTYK
eukprot:15025302-Ditylum_brightwellii.AAC.1